MTSLIALGMSQYLSIICHEAPDLTREQIKARAEELFPYRMGMNNHNDILYMGYACQEAPRVL